MGSHFSRFELEQSFTSEIYNFKSFWIVFSKLMRVHGADMFDNRFMFQFSLLILLFEINKIKLK